MGADRAADGARGEPHVERGANADQTGLAK